jgi:hypothetical protein
LVQEEAMKATILTALTLAMLASQPDGVSAQHATTPSELADDVLTTTLWQIGVATHTRIGFQSVEVVHAGGRNPLTPPAAPISSLEDALDAAIAANPRYEWRRMGDFVVVRPTEAWNDVRDVFNQPVRQFRAERTTESVVLAGVSDLMHARRYDEGHRYLSGTPVRFAVESGTPVDVLNKLIESADLVLWQGAYRLPAPEEGDSQPDVDDLMLLNATGLRAFSSHHMPNDHHLQ